MSIAGGVNMSWRDIHDPHTAPSLGVATETSSLRAGSHVEVRADAAPRRRAAAHAPPHDRHRLLTTIADIAAVAAVAPI